MKRSKKVFIVLLALVMVVSLFAGCQNNNQNEDQNNANQSDNNNEANNDANENTNNNDNNASNNNSTNNNGGLDFPELPDNTLTLEVNIPNFGTSPIGTEIQQMWHEEMEEYLGVTLDITFNITPWADYQANEKILLQSADIPDVATYSQGNYVNEYGSDGIVLDILQYEDYMEHYPKFVKDTNGGEAYAYNQNGTAYYFMDGFVNKQDITGAQSFTSFAYRFDVLQDNGLKPATTIDEFTQLCADIQSLIDDGTIDANYVMTNQDKNYAFYRGFVGIFHTWDTLYWNGNEWAFGPIEDNFREMLKYINSLYEEGYIDPEFATDDGNACTEKAVNGNHIVAPTLWAGMPRYWNTQTPIEGLEWGNAFLPENDEYGTPWKWGSRQEGYSVQDRMGIIINANTEYPEYVVRMIDYQYSDELIEMMNWGIEGETYTVEGEDHIFTDTILEAEDPVQAAADYGIMSSSACRTGIPFTPLTFEAMVEQIPAEPWWNTEEGYYMGKYWNESGKIGGSDSVSPFDRPPVLTITEEEATEKAELTTNCELYARENALKFITGEMDVYDDEVWNQYVEAVKTQVYGFEDTMDMLMEKSVLD